MLLHLVFDSFLLLCLLRGEESISLADCLQVAFSRSYRHHIFVVYAREIVIMDIETKQEVGSISLERNSSPFLQIMPCKQRNVLYCLHENGCVSVRVQQSLQFPDSIPVSPLESAPRGVSYELHCHSEPLRISKNCNVYAGAFCPTTERRISVLTSEGKILLLDLEFVRVGIYGQELTEENSSTLLTALPLKRGMAELVDTGRDDEGYGDRDGIGLTLEDTIAPHWFLPSESMYMLPCRDALALSIVPSSPHTCTPSHPSHDTHTHTPHTSHPHIIRRFYIHIWSPQSAADPGGTVVWDLRYTHHSPHVSPPHDKELVLLQPPACRGKHKWLRSSVQPLPEGPCEGACCAHVSSPVSEGQLRLLCVHTHSVELHMHMYTPTHTHTPTHPHTHSQWN